MPNLRELDYLHANAENKVPFIHEPLLVMTWSQRRLEGVVLDMDGTLYRNPLYRQHVLRREHEAIADALGWPPEEGPQRFEQAQVNHALALGRNPRRTETIEYLGLSRSWWDQVRDLIYSPELYIERDEKLIDALDSIVRQGKRVAVATNSPQQVAEKILSLLGVGTVLRGKIAVFGSDALGISKPDPGFFPAVTAKIDLSPEVCISIGDEAQNDIHPAIEAGMGAVLVNGGRGKGVIHAIEQIQHPQAFQPLDLAAYAQSQYTPGEVTVVGLTGRAGAGKTTTARQLLATCNGLGIPAAVLGLDSFFRLSSRERKAWLAEGEQIGPEEYVSRANQDNWWNFDAAAEALATLKAGRPLHLTGVYSRENKGELVGEIHVDPGREGLLVIFEGVGIPRIPKEYIDRLDYIHAHPRIRQDRLLGRDGHRVGTEALKRFEITQRYEAGLFTECRRHIDEVVNNGPDGLRTLPSLPHL